MNHTYFLTIQGYVVEEESKNIEEGRKQQPRFDFNEVFFGESYGEILNLKDDVLD